MKNQEMKFILPFIFLLVQTFLCFSQEREGETYRITNHGTVIDIQPYVNALNAANMQYHRLKNQRNIIVFDTGVTVELFSGAELIASGREINLENYPDSFPSPRIIPQFFLGSNNYILEQRNNISK